MGFINMFEIKDEERLNLFKAIQAKDETKIKTLLEKTPELIHSKTTTAGSSLLHIAAQQANEAICQLLLNKNHETNPVNKAGKTPYQLTKSDEIKTLLAKHHKELLCEKFYTVSQKHPTGCEVKKCEVMNRKKFEQFLFSTMGYKNEISSGALGITTQYPGTLETIFREDILMMPYYGDLMVILENEQAIQFMENFESDPTSEIPKFEARAFFKLASSGLDLFPFLKNAPYPKDGDTPDIAEAKKMFIFHGLVGTIFHWTNCTESQQDNIVQLPYYLHVNFHKAKIFSTDNVDKNSAIIKEMKEKYTTSVLNLNAGYKPK